MRRLGLGTWVCVIGTAGELATAILVVPAFGASDGSTAAGLFAIALLVYVLGAVGAVVVAAVDKYLGPRRWGWFFGLLLLSLFYLPSYTRLRLNRSRST